MKLSDFKLMDETDTHYKVGHPEGNSFMIPKEGLSERSHAAIQKMAQGGTAGDSDADTIKVNPEAFSMPSPDQVAEAQAAQPPVEVVSDTPQSSSSITNPDPGSSAGISGPVPATYADQRPYGTPDISGNDESVPVNTDAFAKNAAPVPSQAQSPAGPQYPNVTPYLNDYEKAIRGAGAAEGKMGRDTAQAYQDAITQQQQLPSPEEIMAKRQQDDTDFENKLKSQKIDPEHYWNHQGTGSKILSTLGVLVSGLGAGQAGQENMAMKNINSAIDRDIDAQKNDQSNTMNLWKMNREATQNDLQANIMTRNQLLTTAKIKALQAQSSAMGPMAAGRTAGLIADIEQQKAMGNYKMALMQGSNPGPGGTSAIDPERLVAQFVPAEHQKQAFTEIGQAKAANQNADQINALYDQATHDNTILRTGAGYIRTPASIKALETLMDPLIHDNEGRINELEQKHVKSLMPAPGDLQSTIDTKRAALQDFINHKRSSPTANAYGVNLNNYQSTAERAPPSPFEGKTATGPSGQRVVMKNGRWTPY